MNTFIYLINTINQNFIENFKNQYELIIVESPYLNKRGFKRGVYYDLSLKNNDDKNRTGNPPKIGRFTVLDVGNVYISINKQNQNKGGNYNEIKYNIYSKILYFIESNKNSFLYDEKHQQPQFLEEYIPENIAGDAMKHFYRSKNHNKTLVK